MKTLLLMRHAKSSHKEEELDDFDRPLNKRGKRDASRMGQLIHEENLGPDLIVASCAKRTRKTAELVAQECGFRGETRLVHELYEANAERILAVVRGLPDFAARVLLVGHNPGLEEFFELLSGMGRPLTTAALARFELPLENWRQVGGKKPATLKSLWQPRELG